MADTRPAGSQPPMLHIEVRVRDRRGALVRTDLIREEVSQWLREMIHLTVDEEINGYERLVHGASIDSIKVVGISGPEGTSGSILRVQDAQLDVQAYRLHPPDDDALFTSSQTSVDGCEDEDNDGQLHITSLPNESLDGVWESLVFSNGIHSRLLHVTSRTLSMLRTQTLNPTLTNWNGLILLHGPPGSGKTTLCRGLAQKLTIRLGTQYTKSKLVEIHSQSLLSKWFGESANLVGRIFSKIQNMSEDETTLTCVMMDEVESLAGSREKSAASGEVGDALRATNQLLTAVDRLRSRPNVIVLCTSNLITALDHAFLDRVDVKQFVPNPERRAIYEILRGCLNELIRCGLVVNAEIRGVHDVSETSLATLGDPDDSGGDGREMVDPGFLPPAAFSCLCWEDWEKSKDPAMKLWLIAERCAGMSGRWLRRLPFMALAMKTYSSPCSLTEGLAALELAVGEEKAGRMELM